MNDKREDYLIQGLMQQEQYDKIYGFGDEIRKSVIEGHARNFKDYIYGDYIEKDPCDDNRYNIHRTENSSSSSSGSGYGGGGDGGCWGCIASIGTCVVSYAVACWCCHNPEEISEGCAKCCVGCCTGACSV